MAYNVNPLDKSRRSPSLVQSLTKLLEYEQSPNIAELLEEEQLKKIGYDVEREYQIDKKSRSDWEESANRAMDIALQVRKPKNYPFENAANIKYPLVTVAALQFGARAYPAIVDGNRIVKAQVIGNDAGQPQVGEDGKQLVDPMNGEPLWVVPPGVKQAKADRVSRHMSYQLMHEMVEWEEDTDVLLHHLPIIGCAMRKVYRSAEQGRNKAEMVPALNLVVNNKVRSLEEAPRVTHEIYLYPQEIEERKRNETFLDVDLPTPSSEGNDTDDDAPHLFLEQHRYLDLDDDGYREPYIVTVHKDSCQVVRIVANYRVEDIKDNGKRIIRIPKEEYFVKYSFIPDPKGGFYDIGFGKLLESLSETIDTTINQMLDAGHVQNAGGGFIGSGVRLKKNMVAVSPGRFHQIETTGDLRQQIYQFQHPGPSPVLFTLLGMMIDAARDITAVKDILTGDSGDKGVQTATTTLALIEQGLKVFTAIYKRVYRAMRDEFKLLFALNARHLSDQEYYTFNDQQQIVAKADYDVASLDICPVADPKMVTDMQRSGRANVLLQLIAAQLPINPYEGTRRILETVGEPDLDRLIIPQPQGPSPQEQLMVADAEAEIAKKQASAKKDEAAAQKTMIEAQMKPAEMMLAADKIETDAASAADQHAIERERMVLDQEARDLDRKAAKEPA